MQIHKRLAVTVWLILGLMASGLSVAQSSPGSGAEKVMQKVRCRDCMTSISYSDAGKSIIES